MGRPARWWQKEEEAIRDHSQCVWSWGPCSAGSEGSMVVAHRELHHQLALTT